MIRASPGTDEFRIDDNDKLREKVDEALAVFNDYVKTQNTDGVAQQEGGSSEHQPNGEGEEAKS